MSIYRPKYKDPKSGKLLTSRFWWYSFSFAGKRVRESAKTHLKTRAKEAENLRRREMENAFVGAPSQKRESRINSVVDIVKAYSLRYKLDHRGRPQSILFSKGRLAHVVRLLGSKLLPDLTEDTVRGYIAIRLSEGASGRTVNMEVGELSRAIGMKWSALWPRVRRQEERRDAGRALSPEEESRLLTACISAKRSQVVETIVRIALLTGMRSGEITGLTWDQVNFHSRVLTVGRTKTSSGTGRQIPLSAELFQVLTAHAEWFTRKFGAAKPEHYLFPFGKPSPTDPTRPLTTLKTVWGSVREDAGLNCRFHDLRHTAATKMAEAGIPESTMLALMGHMSRAMLERYSHVRMAAKREAVEALSLTPKDKKPVETVKEPAKVAENQTIQ